MPDAVAEGDGDREAHCDVWSEVPGLVSALATMAQDEHWQDDVDDDVGEGIVLLLSGSSGRVFGFGHENVRRGGEIWKGPAESGPLEENGAREFTRSKWYFQWSEARRKPASCGHRGTARPS